MTDVDVLTAALHGDHVAVLTDQRERIEREMIERRAINISTRETIHELLADLRQDIMNLEPLHQGSPDDAVLRHERFRLKEEFRRLVLLLSAEQRSCWSDHQPLRLEARHVEQDLLRLRQRDRRLREFT